MSSIKLLNFAQIKFYFLESPPVHFALIILKMSLPEKPTFSYSNTKTIWGENVSRKGTQKSGDIGDPASYVMVEIRPKAPRRSGGGLV